MLKREHHIPTSAEWYEQVTAGLPRPEPLPERPSAVEMLKAKRLREAQQEILHSPDYSLSAGKVDGNDRIYATNWPHSGEQVDVTNIFQTGSNILRHTVQTDENGLPQVGFTEGKVQEVLTPDDSTKPPQVKVQFENEDPLTIPLHSFGGIHRANGSEQQTWYSLAPPEEQKTEEEDPQVKKTNRIMQLGRRATRLFSRQNKAN